jgi:hypothetical protein
MVDERRLRLHPRVEAVGQGEHQMVVRHRQDPCELALTPLGRGASLALGAVAVTAGMVTRDLVITLRALAAQPLAAQRRRAAGADVRAHLALAWVQCPAFQVSGQERRQHRL